MRWLCFNGQKPLHRTTLDAIFYKTKEFPMDKQGNLMNNLEGQAIEQIRLFVKDKTKILIDYLENNQGKLKNVGRYLQ